MSLLPAHKTSRLRGGFFHIANTFEVTDILENKSKTFVDCIKFESLNNCQNKRWSPFSCLMALSSVLGLDIHSFYPDMGRCVPMSQAHNVFNADIKPRIEPESTLTPVRLLWTRLDTLMQRCRKSFVPNHIGPFLC